MRIGIVGCGLIGHKRALNRGEDTVVCVADPNREAAERLAGALPGCEAVDRASSLFERDDIDAVVIATTHHVLAPLTLEALRRGKHVLVEKPGARSAEEFAPVVEAARAAGRTVKVGFNHRFHPAFRQARAIFETGALGPMMYIRAFYGHGGRIGYDREWRAQPELSGGGELIDQGMHLIDLARWFMGDFAEVHGRLPTLFWDMPVEDNAFLSLQTASGAVAWLHATWTEWKNCFRFEICGRDGKLQIDGLGGSYGPEKLTHYRMLPQMGPPESEAWAYPGPDESWAAEWANFRAAAQGLAPACGDAEDALAALRIVERLYRAGR